MTVATDVSPAMVHGLAAFAGAGRLYRFGGAYRFHTDFIDEDYMWLTFDLYTKDDINDTAGTHVQNALGLEYQVTPWFAARIGEAGAARSGEHR